MSLSIIDKSRFADLVPDRTLSLEGLPAAARTLALEAAYDSGFCGCFLPDMEGPLGRAARYLRDELRDFLGKNQCWTSDVQFGPYGDDTAEGYIASTDAFSAWGRDKDPTVDDWLFGIFQNSGCCVGASKAELTQGVLGTRAMDPATGEIMKWLAIMWTYPFRGSCGQGWYTATCAKMSIEHGWCPSAKITVGSNSIDTDGESNQEKLCTTTWCRGGPPKWLQEYVLQNYTWDAGAITELDCDTDTLKAVFRAKGQIHHGSNTTGTPVPGQLKRIGGHAQTAFGGRWDARTLEFYNSRGLKVTEKNFPIFNHQTWGEWSGGLSSKYWPDWYGPMPQGTWVCTSDQFCQLLSRSAYAYLPKLRGVKGTQPITPPVTPPSASGNIWVDSSVSPPAIRGSFVIDGKEYIMRPGSEPGKYVPMWYPS